jgi:hypothetical protein
VNCSEFYFLFRFYNQNKGRRYYLCLGYRSIFFTLLDLKFTLIFTTNFVDSIDTRAFQEVFPSEIKSPEIKERSQRLEINEEEGKRTQNQAREPGEQKIYIDFYCRDIIQSWVCQSVFSGRVPSCFSVASPSLNGMRRWYCQRSFSASPVG